MPRAPLPHNGLPVNSARAPLISRSKDAQLTNQSLPEQHAEIAIDLKMELEDLTDRLTALRATLMQRTWDLGNLPVKPEITSALYTAKTDLRQADEALARQDYSMARARLQRATTTLQYLEKL